MRVSRAEAGAICRANVRYGSLADIAAAPPNVRFTRADSTGQRNTF